MLDPCFKNPDEITLAAENPMESWWALPPKRVPRPISERQWDEYIYRSERGPTWGLRDRDWGWPFRRNGAYWLSVLADEVRGEAERTGFLPAGKTMMLLEMIAVLQGVFWLRDAGLTRAGGPGRELSGLARELTETVCRGITAEDAEMPPEAENLLARIKRRDPDLKEEDGKPLEALWVRPLNVRLRAGTLTLPQFAGLLRMLEAIHEAGTPPDVAPGSQTGKACDDLHALLCLPALSNY